MVAVSVKPKSPVRGDTVIPREVVIDPVETTRWALFEKRVGDIVQSVGNNSTVLKWRRIIYPRWIRTVQIDSFAVG